jgi:Arc-like DNA binding dprotein
MDRTTSAPTRRAKPKLASKRSQFATRISDQLREHLDKFAEINQRSLSEEIESRLQKSIELEQQIGLDMLAMISTYGTAGIYATVLRQHQEWAKTGEWRLDEYCFEYAAVAACKALWSQHPTRKGQSWKQMRDRLVAYIDGLFDEPVETGVPSAEYEAGKRDREETVSVAATYFHRVPRASL